MRTEEARTVEKKITEEVTELVFKRGLPPEQAKSIAWAMYGVAISVAELAEAYDGECAECEAEITVNMVEGLANELASDRLLACDDIQRKVCRRVA